MMKSWFVIVLSYAPIVNARFVKNELTQKITTNKEVYRSIYEDKYENS